MPAILFARSGSAPGRIASLCHGRIPTLSPPRPAFARPARATKGTPCRDTSLVASKTGGGESQFLLDIVVEGALLSGRPDSLLFFAEEDKVILAAADRPASDRRVFVA